jgi:hypothetical protein
MRSAGACCAKSCTATLASSIPHSTSARLFNKNRYYEIVHWVLNSIHRTLIWVALYFNIP